MRFLCAPTKVVRVTSGVVPDRDQEGTLGWRQRSVAAGSSCSDVTVTFGGITALPTCRLTVPTPPGASA